MRMGGEGRRSECLRQSERVNERRPHAALLVIILLVNKRLAKFIAEFKESSRSSRRTDMLFAIAGAFVAATYFTRTAYSLFMVCGTGMVLFAFSGIVSLAFDNRWARRLAE